MEEIPLNEKVIFEKGVLRKVIITDKAVYVKEIGKPVQRYDFSDIICMYVRPYPGKHSGIAVYLNEVRVDKNRPKANLELLLANGDSVMLISDVDKYNYRPFLFLKVENKLELQIGEAIDKNLLQDKILFIGYTIIPQEIFEMIKNGEDPGLIREVLRESWERTMEDEKKRDEKLTDSLFTKMTYMFASFMLGEFLSGIILLPLSCSNTGYNSHLGSYVIVVGIVFAVPIYFLIRKYHESIYIKEYRGKWRK
jgi:hypothetical protein